jgi:hypothetical protein
MSKISQIEAELKTLEQGNFQKLCNSYIYMKYSMPPRGEGEAKGTDKTKPGTPDSFLILQNGNFVFIEYTTQKTRVGKKFLDDLSKNFNEAKTGVPIHKIEKVILCYNSQLSPSETNKILEYCADFNTGVDFLDLDFLKFELYYYPKLAKDFLNLEIDSGQILRPIDFVKEIENKGTSQTNIFLSRENELNKIGQFLKNNNLIVITGKAGLGKTRIALEAIKEFNKQYNSYEPFCILTKGQSIYYDLKAYFLQGRKYIVFVDDANRIGDFLSIVSLIRSEKFEIKIIVTVRDYAAKNIKNQLDSENFSFDFLELTPLEDETVKKILKSVNINYPLCIKNITRIANGNPRLVMMAAEHALIDDDCNKLNDVTDIYNKFFGHLDSKEALKDKTLLSVLGIICFFRVVNKSNTDFIHGVYKSFEISENRFWESVFKLHDLEFVNLYEKRIVKIADQVLANYFFYKVFIKEEVLDFSIILDRYLSGYMGKLKESLYPILEHFNYEKIIEKISPKLDKRLEQVRESENELLNFFNVFGFYHQEEILLFVIKKIEVLPEHNFDSLPYQFRKGNAIDSWVTEKNYPYFELLKLFGQYPNDHFETSIEIIFKYVEKRPDILPEVVQYIEEQLIFDEDDYRYGYWLQIRLFEFIYKKIDEEYNNTLFLDLLLEIAPTFLKTHFQHSKGGRKRSSIDFYQVVLIKTQEIKEFRKKIFERVFNLSESNLVKVLFFLENYSNPREYYPQVEIYKDDMQNVISFIEKKLPLKDFDTCRAVYSYFNFLDTHSIVHPRTRLIIKKFNNRKFKISQALTYNINEWWKESKHRNKEEYFIYNKKRLAFFFSKYNLQDYLQLVEEIHDIVNKNKRNANDISSSLETILLNLLETSPKDCIKVIEHLFDIGNPYQFYSYRIVCALMKDFHFDEVFALIYNNNFKLKQHWLLHYLMNLKVEQITIFYKEELLKLISSLEERHFLSFDFLKNYKSVDPDIFKSVIEILLQNAKDDGVKPDFLAADFFENHFEELESDLLILKKLYFFCFFKQPLPFDSRGTHFKKLYTYDHNFLFEFIEELLNKTNLFGIDDLKINFHFVWEYPDAELIIEKVIELTVAKKHYSGSDSIASKFFPSKDFSLRIDNYIRAFIRNHSSDKERMVVIFSVIRVCYPDTRVKYLEELLIYNRTLDFLHYLPIARDSFSGLVSSLIPFYERQIEFWELLLPIFSGRSEYLRHRQWVQSEIKFLNNKINREIESEFMSDY